MAKQHKQEIIDTCENNFFAFMKLLNPHYQYGDVHEKLCAWISGPDANARQLALLPRGHLKSHIVAGYCVWRITYQPWITIVYLSAGEDLAKDQLYAIKNMMTSDTYKKLWPEMLQDDEGRREQWSAYSFNVDHPDRKRRGIRDHTIIVKTVKSNAIGLHCDVVVFDDVVVPQFADTAVGRFEVNRSLAQFTSILNPGGEIKAVGTRYHPEDAYQGMIDARYPLWDHKAQEFNGEAALWDVMIDVCEDNGDGTGHFIWPRVYDKSTGEGYGFDPEVLALIRADYESKGQKVQYFCQYYNDPNAITNQTIDRGTFQYFDRRNLDHRGGSVYAGGNRLSTFAAMDVAWTTHEASDYTAIAVIGLDADGFMYILDLSQFKTNDFAQYYDEVIRLHRQWKFKKIQVETNAGGQFVKQELERLIRQNGDILAVEGKSVIKNSGSKKERKAATLEWRYDAKTIWHFKDGLIYELEDQIILDRPRHDDLVDALCAAIEISKPPGKRATFTQELDENIVYDSRFGGRRGRVA
jgi:predicted phage terminase large subunit-like protein